MSAFLSSIDFLSLLLNFKQGDIQTLTFLSGICKSWRNYCQQYLKDNITSYLSTVTVNNNIQYNYYISNNMLHGPMFITPFVYEWHYGKLIDVKLDVEAKKYYQRYNRHPNDKYQRLFILESVDKKYDIVITALRNNWDYRLIVDINNVYSLAITNTKAKLQEISVSLQIYTKESIITFLANKYDTYRLIKEPIYGPRKQIKAKVEQKYHRWMPVELRL